MTEILEIFRKNADNVSPSDMSTYIYVT